MDKQSNNLNWFEIPVTDLDRARHFYQVIFSIHMEVMEMGDLRMAGFPGESDSGKALGAIAKSPNHHPSAEGVVIYLNANPAMDTVLEKIEDEGGRILMGKTLITPEIGYMAFFLDTEGNKLGLHSIE